LFGIGILIRAEEMWSEPRGVVATEDDFDALEAETSPCFCPTAVVAYLGESMD